MEHNLNLFDYVRIDHFRAFASYWEIPADEKTAVKGRWVKGPDEDFFWILNNYFASKQKDSFDKSTSSVINLPIIAEDLGYITDDVRELIKKLDFPGMKILLFAFGEDNPHHPYLPHNFKTNCIVYTGTHDNNTVRGWFENEASHKDKMRLFSYLGNEFGPTKISWEFIKLAMKSKANIAIIPMQDVLSLKANARMNIPAKPKGNWCWRISTRKMTSLPEKKLLQLCAANGRCDKP